MNKLLKEIEKQATRRIETKVRKGGWDNDREPYEYKTVVDTFFDKEKFAELIVRQAADMFEVEYGSSEGLSGNRVAAVLKQHFGVEE